MDLHTWITQQVDQRKRVAAAALATWNEPIPPGPLLAELVEYATTNFDLPEERFTALAEENRRRRDEAFPERRTHIAANDPAAVLRRCEADRRILARHRLDPNFPYEGACYGCGTYGDLDLSNVDNLNDCPELLDLAHAHGITPDILAGLDRPQPPRSAPRSERRLGLGDILTATNPITTSDVPEALRGPRWKP
ncbi:DUF6221 family protein [Streptomyces sp. f150]|uniref:DUF6221 family protein n=1 Tax=Streptomyces sp. f150 TaxID=1827699 RepID=UPI000BF127BF|nr:DUF6221 family protein [Streptomyces sp. f150]